VAIFGPHPGGLQNNGERLQLQRTSPPDTNGVYYFYAVDSVRYDDRSPWPPTADGSGASLQRVAPDAYGDDPVNWIAAITTPGRALPAGTAPSIQVPPAGGAAVALSEFTLSAVAGGAPPLRYQWTRNGSNLAGATNATHTIALVLPSDAGHYAVSVYNPFGSVTSQAAEVTVEIPAEITRHPQGVAVFPGNDVQFTVEAYSSSAMSYQWLRNGVPIPGATGTFLEILDVQEDDGGDYTVVVTDAVGSVESHVAALVVLLVPEVVTPPVNTAVPLGGTLVLSLETSGTLPMGYRWRLGSLTVGGETDSDKHYSILVITNFQASHAGNYTVVITNAAFHQPGVLSPRATVTVAVDTDGDGIPDTYESTHGLNPNDPADAASDVDGDGFTALEEYLAGTDPEDENSFLRIAEIVGGGGVEIRFNASAGVSYTVLRAPSAQGPWSKVADVPPQASDGPVSRTDPNPLPLEAFYRLVTPAQLP
jgi:hypothetical protein